jgi:PAS domain S-box-containing protein
MKSKEQDTNAVNDNSFQERCTMRKRFRSLDQLITDVEKQGIIDVIGEAVSIQDTNFKILYQNKKAIDMIGSHRGENCYKAYENEDRVCAGCPLAATFRDGKVRTINRQNSSGDKTLFVEITASPIRGHTGEIIGGIEVVRDITKHKEWEDLLVEAKKDWEETFDIINDAITIHDRDFNIIRANKAAERLLGLPFIKILSQKCYESYHQADRPPGDCPSCRTLVTGEPTITEIYEPTLKKSLEIKALPRFNTGNELIGLIHCVSDITRRKKAERELKHLNDKLSQKNRELEQVLYVTMHDIRSPLVNAAGFSRELDYSLKELLSFIEGKDVPHHIKEKLLPVVKDEISLNATYVQTSIMKMDTMIGGLSAFLRTGSVQLTIDKINMSELITDVISTCEYKLKESGVEIQVSELPECKGDRGRINQVFSNLLDNAIKYLNKKQPGIVRVSGYRENGCSVYCVEDNGIGIAPKYQDKIFNMFYQLKPEQSGGEGLGLTIARRIIDMHKGKIWIESEPGSGSRFFVSLPA